MARRKWGIPVLWRTGNPHEKILAEWEDACVFAHGGQAQKTPGLVAARLIVAGDKLAEAVRKT